MQFDIKLLSFHYNISSHVQNLQTNSCVSLSQPFSDADYKVTHSNSHQQQSFGPWKSWFINVKILCRIPLILLQSIHNGGIILRLSNLTNKMTTCSQ